MNLNQTFTFDGNTIGADIECNLDMVIYSDPDRIENLLNDQGVHHDNPIRERVEAQGQIACIKNVNVEEDERGQGYGSQLMYAAIEELDRHGVECFLQVDEGEEQQEGFDLYEFYKRFNFNEVGNGESPFLMR